ncbi:MAG: hypothetical protein K0R00_4402, partial [Herbinix sp.]|nr:hypothetical protein [Herbinix sp.]
DSINNYGEKVSDLSMKNKRKHSVPMLKYTLVAAASVLICFMIAVNTSETFAQVVSNLPVLGGISRVLTIQSYQTSEDNMNISVNVPAIVTDDSQIEKNTSAETDIGINEASDNDDTLITGSNDQFIIDINAEIDEIVNNYLTDAKSRMQVDKDAFIATGGTEEDWTKRDLNIKVNYEVKYQQGSLLSLVLSADESWYGAYDLNYFYNLDLKENKVLTLKDVMGEDFTKIANTSIIKQMKERADDDLNVVYWGITDNDKSGIDGFTSVDENTNFYLNEEGKPVIYYDKYEIAPGFMGTQEFTID